MSQPDSMFTSVFSELVRENPNISVDNLLDRALRRLRPPAIEELLGRCALPRTFDRALFEQVLCPDLTGPPKFADLIGLPEIEPISRTDEVYALTGSARQRYAVRWKQIPNEEVVNWHRKFFDWYTKNRPRASVERLYHLLYISPVEAKKLFEAEFDAAEQRFDLALCYSLLQVLNECSDHLDADLSTSHRSRVRRYRVRSFFAADYYATATYFERDEPFSTFRHLYEAGQRRVLHLHATGGMGKTMFLRWLISRYLVPRGSWCARVDFDDFRFESVKQSPWLVLLAVAQQWAAQEEFTYFGSLVSRFEGDLARLDRWTSLPTTEPQLPELARSNDFRASFQSALTQLPTDQAFVVILDTIEEVTLDAAVLTSLLVELELLNQTTAKAIVILAGRYNIALKAPELKERLDSAGETLKIARFTRDESRMYLKNRGLKNCDVIEAVIEKAYEEPGGDEFEQTPGCTPFTLRFFAEIVLGRADFTEEEVRSLPRRDFAYLLERVVLRIDDQPLRWVIRYGVVPRVLTVDFVEKVLIDPLREALISGRHDDQPSQVNKLPQPVRQYSQERGIQDIWKREPEREISTDAIWKMLSRYASPDGWITMGKNSASARFHGDVATPMRALLYLQDIFPFLQDRACKYFEGLSAQAASKQSDSDEDRAYKWCEYAREAIFHTFQKCGTEAVGYWEQKLASPEAVYPKVRAMLGEEILRREYTENGIDPIDSADRPALVDCETLAKAHAIALESSLAALTEAPSAESSQWIEITRHRLALSKLETRLSRRFVPQCMLALYEAISLDQKSRYPEAAELLEKSLEQTETDGQRLAICFHLARILMIIRSSDAPRRFREAFALRRSMKGGFPGEALIRSWLISYYRSENYITAAREELANGARDAEAGGRFAESRGFKLQLVDIEMQTGSLDRAGAILAGIETQTQIDQSPEVWLRRGSVFRDSGRLIEALEFARLPAKQALTPLQQGLMWTLRGSVLSSLLDFDQALQAFEQAGLEYRRARMQLNFEAVYLGQIELKVRNMGWVSNALTMVEGARQFRAHYDMAFHVRFRLAEIQALFMMDRPDEARSVLQDLTGPQTTSWPAVLRATVLSTALGLGIFEADQAVLQRLTDLLAELPPGIQRAQSLAGLRLRARSFDFASLWRDRLLRLLWRPDQNSASYFRDSLLLGEIHSAVGARESASELLRAPIRKLPQPIPFIVRDLLDAIRRHGDLFGAHEFGIYDALRRQAGDWPMMQAAISIEWGRAALIARSQFPQVEIADSASYLKTQSLPTRWHALVNEVLGDFESQADSAGKSGFYLQAAEAWRALGMRICEKRAREKGNIGMGEETLDTSSVAEVRPHGIATQGILAQWGLNDGVGVPVQVVDRLFQDWRTASRELWNSILAENPKAEGAAELRIRLAPSAVASIPWELALAVQPRLSLIRGFSFAGTRQGYSTESVRWVQASLRMLQNPDLPVDGVFGPTTLTLLRDFQQKTGLSPTGRADGATCRALVNALLAVSAGETRVLVLEPETSASFMSESTYSAVGTSLASEFYHGLNPTVLEDPHPEAIEHAISNLAPNIVHIVATLKDMGDGFCYIDFAKQDMSFGLSVQADRERMLGSSNLARLLHAFRGPGPKPVVILDAVTTSNPREDIRSLLLRNAYATELFQNECTSAVLCIGLGTSQLQSNIMGLVNQAIRGGSSLGDTIRGIRDLWKDDGNPTLSQSTIAYLGAALFTEDLNLPLCLVRTKLDT